MSNGFHLKTRQRYNFYSLMKSLSLFFHRLIYSVNYRGGLRVSCHCV